MAAYTSTQSGNWSDPATWGGGGTPGDGDTASIGAHTVTVDVNTTVGTSPNDTTTNAIALTSGSAVLNVGSGVTLTVKGSIGLTHDAIYRQQAGSTVTFDASASGGTPIYGISNGGFTRWEFFGTAGSPAVIQAVDGRLANMSAPTSTVTATYATFRRIAGLFTSHGMYGGATVTDCRFESCGSAYLAGASATVDCILDGNVFESGTGASDIRLEWFGTPTTGTRSLRGNVLAAPLMYNSVGFACEGNYFGGGIDGFSGTSYSRFRHNFVKGGRVNGQVIPSSVSRSYFWHDSANPHFVDPRAAAVDAVFAQNVFESAVASPTDVGDCLLAMGTPTSGGAKIIGRNNLVLRDATGDVSSGCLLTAYSLADGVVTEWYHNTASVENSEFPDVGKRGMVAVAEGGDGFAGQVAVLKSNLAWAVAASQGFLGERVQGDVKDIITPAGADYNWRYNTSDGDNGRGYEDRAAANTLWTAGDATAAGVDVNGGTGDPQFVDSSRNLATWATARGYGSTNADGLAAIQADPSRTRDLIAYVFEGFKPQNAAMRTAAHDGGVVGAANYHDSTRSATTLGYHGAIVADAYGIAYTGDLPAALVPPVLTATSAGAGITLEWTAATGGVEPYTYDVYRDGVLLAAAESSPYVDSTGNQGVTYAYLVRVTDTVDDTADSNEAEGTRAIIVTDIDIVFVLPESRIKWALP